MKRAPLPSDDVRTHLPVKIIVIACRLPLVPDCVLEKIGVAEHGVTPFGLF